MKRTLFVITLNILAALALGAQEKSGPTVVVTSYIANQYLGFATGNPLSDDPISQSDIYIGHKTGIFADLAISRSLKGSWNDGSFGNEVDYAAGWKGSIGHGISLKVGVTYFDEPSALTLGRGDIVNPWVYLTKDFTNFSVTAGYENFTPLPNSGYSGGDLFSLGASITKAFYRGKLGARGSAFLVYDTGTIGSGKGFLWRGNLGFDWHVSQRLTANIFGMNWYVPMMSDKRSTDAMIWSGISYRFN
jgi:hypothetical protein